MLIQHTIEWTGDIKAARQLQEQLAQHVVLKDRFPKQLRTIGGFDVGFEEDGRITRAAAVLLDANTLDVIDSQIARIDTVMPYIPGLLSFRELPALLKALQQLPSPPDLAFIDGQGIAHPRRLGIAAHFGVVTEIPSIGVAKKILTGNGPVPHETRGAYTALRDKGTQIGWLLRSKLNCLPLIVSPGHNVAMASAADLTMQYITTYRLPEPTRLADKLASRR